MCRWIGKALKVPRGGGFGAGGDYEIREIFGIARRADGSVGVFAGSGQGWDRDRSWAGLRRGWTACLRLRLLSLRSVRVCAIRVLWPKLFRKWHLHWYGTLVSLGTSSGVLEPRLLWTRLVRTPGLGLRTRI